MENGPFEIFEDVFPIEHGEFSIAMLVYWRVTFQVRTVKLQGGTQRFGQTLDLWLPSSGQKKPEVLMKGSSGTLLKAQMKLCQ